MLADDEALDPARRVHAQADEVAEARVPERRKALSSRAPSRRVLMPHKSTRSAAWAIAGHPAEPSGSPPKPAT
jgi:hypothetical protein